MKINLKKVLNPLGKSMALNLLYKPVGMIISLLYTPLLLRCLGDESYGLWSAVLSIVNWINYFDVGIGNGLRNELAKNVAEKDENGAKLSTSTAYIILSLISSIVLVVGSLIIYYMNCNAVFNTEINVKPALLTSFVFICINFVLALSKVQLYATQQAEKIGFMTVLTQLFNLIGVFVLEKIGIGNILTVAILVGVSGVIVNLIFTFDVWNNHPEFIPNPHFYTRSKLNVIGSLGIRFFIIQIAALVLYTTDNIIITRLFGPEFVTPYHTCYAAFGVINGLFSAMTAPLWSQYTVAKSNGDYKWIKKTIIKLDLLLIPIAIGLAIGVFLFKPLARLWLGKNLMYESGLIVTMAIYYFAYIWGTIYSSVLNGLSKVNLQMFLGIGTAILNIPLSIIMAVPLRMGTTGVLAATVICMLISEIPVTISTHKYLNKKIH